MAENERVRILLVFLDGVGLGEDDASRNVFSADPPEWLGSLFGGATLTAAGAPFTGPTASLHALDACFGVDGIPQSGTGQTALLTGRDAVAVFGRHFGPWVPAVLQPVVREHSILARARRAGRAVAFANAYPEEIVADAAAADTGTPANARQEAETSSAAGAPTDRVGRARSRRASRFLSAGPPLAALGAGVLVRHTEALRRGEALASEITNDAWRTSLGRRDLPRVDPHDAGITLSHIAAGCDLTLFAHYGTDYAGHSRSLEAARASLRRVDRFLGGIVESMPPDMLLVVSSDHGNIEDATTGHTRNPAIGLVVGPGHEAFSAGWRSLTDVAPSILRALGVETGIEETGAGLEP